MTIFILSEDGKRLMPTFNIKKVRHMLRSGKAKIVKHHPFAVQILRETGNGTQPINFTEDTGYQHIGASIKSEKHEYVSAEYELLRDEKNRHADQVREHRRPRRNKKRYRKPKFNNRKKPEGNLAPSVKNKADRHVDLFKKYAEVCPITEVTLEMGQFDPAALDAVEQGKPVPEGLDYQHGPRYGYDTLREAVFARDSHKCIVCGKSDVPLRLHHIGFRNGDRSNRMSNLATVCEDCHCPKNHKPGGKLWDLESPKGTAAATFINIVRWYIYDEIKKLGVDVHITYGAVTKRTRKDRNIEKSHANDAYCIGDFRPKHRSKTQYYKKRRRNNRVLEKFYDAAYIDSRDGKKKKAAELGCNRTDRSVPRNNPSNERPYRGEKVSSGRRTIRRRRYAIQPGTVCRIGKRILTAKGCHCYGTRVIMDDGKSYPISKVKIICQPNGWIETHEKEV